MGPFPAPGLIGLIGLLALIWLAATAFDVSAELEGGDLELGVVAYSPFDTDLDGLDDGVRVDATVHNGNTTRSLIFTLEVVLTDGTAYIDQQTTGALLDPGGSTTVTLRVATGKDTPAATYTVRVVLHAEHLHGDVKGEDETTLDLFPLGDYKLTLDVNRTSVEAMENTSAAFTFTVKSLSNNPTVVEANIGTTLNFPFQLDPRTLLLEPQRIGELSLTVLVPVNAAPGSREVVEIEVVAQRNITAFTTLSVVVTVEMQVFNVVLELDDQEVFIASGGTVTTGGSVINRGNNLDNVTFQAVLPTGWSTAFEPPFLLLGRGASGEFDLHLNASTGVTGSGVLEINITARSQGLVHGSTRVLRVVYNTAELLIDEGNVSLSPTTPVAGEDVTLQATIRNAGAVIAKDVSVVVTLDGVEIARTILASILPGGLGVATLTWTPEPGTFLLRVEVDPDGSIPEIDETNNQSPVTIVVTSPDLSVVPPDITIHPSYPTEGTEATIGVMVANKRQLATGPFEVRLLVDGTLMETFTVGDGLAGGANVTLEWTWVAEGGRHTFEVEVDPDGQVLEEDRSNNVASRSFSVNGMPVATLTTSKDRAFIGDVVTLDGSSSLDPDGRVRQYFFDYGDGTDSGWVFLATVNHTYTEVGEYEVRLYVRDEAGAQNEDPVVANVTIVERGSSGEPTPGPGAIVALVTLAAVAAIALVARRHLGTGEGPGE